MVDSSEQELDDQELSNNISQIADQLFYGRIGFLFGAGMSKLSGGIQGDDLAFKLIWQGLFKHRHPPLDEKFEKELHSLAGKYPLEAIAEGVKDKFPYNSIDLVNLLKREVFGDEVPDINEGHKELSSIVKRFNINMLFTTNWDDLLERAIGDRAEPITT